MAGFQTASLMVPDFPVLYGTTLAISLVGSVAALNAGGIAVPFAQFEYALGLAENASVAVTRSPVMNAAEPGAVNDSVVLDRVEVPVVKTPLRTSSISAERPLSTMPIGLEAAQRMAVAKLAKADLAKTLRQEPKAAPQAISAPAIAALDEPQHDSPVAAPTSADVTAQPSQSFVETFQSMPTPSLAVAAERQDAVRYLESAVLNTSALTTVAAKPDQDLAAFAPVPVASQSRLIDLPTTSPAVVQTHARAPETAVALDQVAIKLTATSGTLHVETALQKAEAKPAPAVQPLRLINSPQLRKFDLARIHAPARTPTASLSPATAKSGQAGKVRITGVKDRLVGGAVFHQVTVTVAGSSAKPLDVRIGADMKPSIKVGDLLGLVSDRMDPASAARFAAAASAGEYVSLARLRASGFNVSYNAATDSISIDAAH